MIDLLKAQGAIPESAKDIQCEVVRLRPELAFRSDSGIVKLRWLDQGKEQVFQCLAKFCPIRGSISNRAVFNILGGQFKEVNFYRQRALRLAESGSNNNQDTPDCYFADYSALTGNACLIIEFMGDNVVHSEYPGCVESDLFTAMHGFAAFHASNWGCPEKECAKFSTIPEEVAFLFDFIVRNVWGDKARSLLLSGWNRSRVSQTLIHGDAKIGNMMFPLNDNGRYVFIDFQAVRKGNAAFDIAYFLNLSCPVELRREHEENALKSYHEELAKCGVKNYSYDQFHEDYKHACVEVLTMVALPMLGSEGSFDDHHAQVFAFGIDLWYQRIKAKFDDFDYDWISANYNCTPDDARAAVNEMLNSMKGLVQEFEARA